MLITVIPALALKSSSMGSALTLASSVFSWLLYFSVASLHSYLKASSRSPICLRFPRSSWDTGHSLLFLHLILSALSPSFLLTTLLLMMIGLLYGLNILSYCLLRKILNTNLKRHSTKAVSFALIVTVNHNYGRFLFSRFCNCPVIPKDQETRKGKVMRSVCYPALYLSPFTRQSRLDLRWWLIAEVECSCSFVLGTLDLTAKLCLSKTHDYRSTA